MTTTAKKELKLNLVLFRSNGVLFGVELFQVAEISEPKGANLPSGVRRLDEELFGGSDDPKKSGKVFKLKRQGPERGVMANSPEDIVEISIEAVRPLPAIVGKLKTYGSLWGGFIYKEEIGLLLDLERFCDETGEGKAAA